MNQIQEIPTGIFKPLPWQIPVMRDRSPVLLASGPAGAGRSRVMAEKVHAFLKKYPGAAGLMMRKNRQSMTNSTVLFFERTIIEKDKSVRHYPSKFRFEYPNGSILAYGGMADDDQKESIRSIGPDGALDIAWLEEANKFEEGDFNEVIARMRGKAGGWRQILLSTNPDAPTHWIRRRLILGGGAKHYPAGPLDNPYNPSDYIANLETLTGVTKQRLLYGKWVQAEGAVYEGWDDSYHVVDPFDIPRSWRRIRVCDFGYINPFVTLFAAIDPSDRIYIYREIYMSRRTVSDHALTINEYSYDEDFEATVADHDSGDRAELDKNGIYTVPADKDVERGLKLVQERLRLREDGKPGVMVFRHSLVEVDPILQSAGKPTCLAEEMPSYTWAKVQPGKPEKEVPLKLHDHAIDALRYLVMYLDNEYGIDFA